MQLLKTAMITFGLLAIVIGIFVQRRSRLTRRWPTVKADIVASRFEAAPIGEHGALFLAFRFRIGGQPVTSKEIKVSTPGGSAADLHQYLDRFAQGKKLTVQYNPANHDAVLVDDSAYAGWREAILAGIALIAIALLLID